MAGERGEAQAALDQRRHVERAAAEVGDQQAPVGRVGVQAGAERGGDRLRCGRDDVEVRDPRRAGQRVVIAGRRHRGGRDHRLADRAAEPALGEPAQVVEQHADDCSGAWSPDLSLSATRPPVMSTANGTRDA